MLVLAYNSLKLDVHCFDLECLKMSIAILLTVYVGLIIFFVRKCITLLTS